MARNLEVANSYLTPEVSILAETKLWKNLVWHSSKAGLLKVALVANAAFPEK